MYIVSKLVSRAFWYEGYCIQALLCEGVTVVPARFRACLTSAALAVCLLAGCGSSTWQYDPITDVNNLEGRRVGVNLAWEGDYVLTGRDDMELYRYDDTADMIMALSYDKIDAIVQDDLMWKRLDLMSEGVERTEAVADVGYVAYFAPDDEALMEDFNAFLKDYKQTDAYQELIASLENYDGDMYEGPCIPLTGTGDVLHVAVDPLGYPRAFEVPETGELTGFDVEPIKAYANDRGYRIDFSLVEFTGVLTGLRNGSYDLYVSYVCDAYAFEARDAGLYVSDAMHSSPLYFVQKNQKTISVMVDEL